MAAGTSSNMGRLTAAAPAVNPAHNKAGPSPRPAGRVEDVAALLAQLSGFVGKDEAAFFSSISSSFRRAYSSHHTSLRNVVKSVARVEWAVSQGCPLDAKLGLAAASDGQLPSLQYVVAQGGCELSESGADLSRAAACGGHISTLDWLMREGGVEQSKPISSAAGAARMGQLELLKWLYDAGVQCWHHDVTESACQSGDIHTLEWLKEVGCPMEVDECLGAAATSGHTEVIAWLRDNAWDEGEEDWAEEVAEVAASEGMLAVVEWVKATTADSMWDVLKGRVMVHAVEAGAMNIIYWLAEMEVAQADGHEPFTWSPEVVNEVWLGGALFGQLKALEWLKDNGLPWDEAASHAALYGACRGGHLEVAKWVVGQGHEFLASHEDLCTGALKAGQHTVLLYLRQHGCPCTTQVAMSLRLRSMMRATRVLANSAGDLLRNWTRSLVGV